MITSARPAQNTAIFPTQIESPSSEAYDLCIICDGAASIAIGCILAARGQNIRLWPIKENEKTINNFVEALPLEFETRERGATVSTSRERTRFGIVTADSNSALKGSDGVIVSQSITEYGALADRLATILTNGQTVVLCNAPIGAAMQFRQLMRRRNKELQINVIEVGNVFDCARLEGGVLLITGSREKISYCGNTRNETRRAIGIIKTISDGVVPTSNVIERGLSEVEKILRPVFLLFALLGGRGDLHNIGDLINPSLTKLVASLDAEVQSLAKVYHVVVPSFLETLTHFGGVAWEDADTLGQALINISGNMIQRCTIDERSPASAVLTPDGACSLLGSDITATFTLLSEFARLSRMHAPVINSVIDLASVITRIDPSKSGRKLSDLGLLGFDVQEIIEIINA